MNKEIRLKQYFTPGYLVEYMVSQFVSGKDNRILEPSFGEGIFIEELLEQAPATCFIEAVEIDEELVEKVKEKFSGFPTLSVRKGNFLEYVGIMKEYDLIIGNPPFGKCTPEIKFSLDEAFVNKAESLLKPEGRIAFLLEAKFSHTIGRFKSLFENKLSISRMDFLVKRPSFSNFQGTSTRDFTIFEFKKRGKVKNIEINWVYFDTKGKLIAKVRSK